MANEVSTIDKALHLVSLGVLRTDMRIKETYHEVLSIQIH